MDTDSRESGSSRNTVHLAVTILCLVILFGALVLLGAAFVRWQFTRATRVHALRARQAARALVEAEIEAKRVLPEDLAAAGKEPRELARETCERFFGRLRAGEFAAAYEKQASWKFRQRQSLDEFRQFLNANPVLLGDAFLSELELEEGGMRARCRLRLTVNGEPKGTATVGLTAENSAWKVDQIDPR